jgi:hypothetical protein
VSRNCRRQKEVAEPEPGEVTHPSRAFGGLWSRRDRAHTVEFRLLDPNKPDESLDYNYLPRVSWHKGRGEIALLYDRARAGCAHPGPQPGRAEGAPAPAPSVVSSIWRYFGNGTVFHPLSGGNADAKSKTNHAV